MKLEILVSLLLLSSAACSDAVDDESGRFAPDAGARPEAPAPAGVSPMPAAMPPGRPMPARNAPMMMIGLVINEVAAAADPDWFELKNTSDIAIDISGFTFTDDIAGQPTRGAFPPGTVIGPGAYLVKQIGPAVGFSFSSGEELGLFAPNGQKIDMVDWNDGDSPRGKTFARFPDGTGPFVTTTPTPGAANVAPR